MVVEEDLDARDAPDHDVRLGQRSGLDVLSRIKAERPHVICIMITSHVDHQDAILALRHGAYDYLVKPCVVEDLKTTIARAIEHRRSTLLAAEQDRMIVPETQRFMAERMRARVRSHAVDHAPIVTAPQVVLDMLHEAISAVQSDGLSAMLSAVRCGGRP